MASENFQSNKGEVMKHLTAQEERALEAIGVFIEGEAISRARVDMGNLKSSITHKVDASDLSVQVGTNVEYAIYVEKGTGRYAEDGKGRATPWVYTNRHGDRIFTHGSKPYPFLTPAIEQNIGKIRQLAKDMMSF